ncbi:MADS-box transcription factor 14 [Triticum urartu]|uniref:MADS-box transcription factor 14 n=13 Tax=Triticum TaxID=4564 RepID=M8AT01_TRIUA|nr:MADS-box transcription factor 14 [Triticum urartu]
MLGKAYGKTGRSMDKILERYERYSYAEKVLVSSESEIQGNWCHEYRKLKAKVETIQKCQKHLMGEDLESLNLKELQQLEQQLESSLKHIRSRKNQLMHESISELQKKERSLQEENKVLQKELVEKQKAHAAQQDQTQPQTSSSSSSFMLRDAPPAANTSIHPAAAGERAEDAAVQPQAPPRTGPPPWMVGMVFVLTKGAIRFMCDKVCHTTGFGCIGEVCTKSRGKNEQCMVPKRLAKYGRVEVLKVHKFTLVIRTQVFIVKFKY